MAPTCPSCNSSTIKKNGHIHNDKQNHQCLSCGRQFVLDPQNKIIDEKTREQIRRTCSVNAVNLSKLNYLSY